MNNTTPSITPYKGLMPYSEKDASFFFGRNRDRKIITANLRASRLTLLYGASGVGKSSVLRAGVAHNLRILAQQNLARRGTPEFAVAIFPQPGENGKLQGKGVETWQDDPIIGLTNCVKDAVERALNHEVLEPMPSSRSLVEELQAWTDRAGVYLLIILDQFEEYFLYHSQENGEDTFAVEFPRAVNHPELRANFLISIRDDALAQLDSFKGRIPKLFGNYLRIDHLEREEAGKAIEEPIKLYNRLYATNSQQMGIEPELVNAVLDQITSIQANQNGSKIVSEGYNATTITTRIKAPYLQLVMTRLWEEEKRANSQMLRLETLSNLGGVKHISEIHLNERMNALTPDEQEVAARVFDHLVTSSGTKKTENVSDLAYWAKLGEAQVAPVLNKLCGSAFRILRPVAPPSDQPHAPRYEIFHDALARPMLDWKAHYESEKKLSKINKQLTAAWEQVKRLRNIIIFIISLGILVIGLVYWQDWRAKLRDGQARSEHLGLLKEELDKAVNDTTLLRKYKNLSNTYPDYSGIVIVRESIERLEESKNHFERLLAVLHSDTLIIMQKLDSLRNFIVHSNRKVSPEKTYAEKEMSSLDSLIKRFASIDNLEKNFVLCLDLANDTFEGKVPQGATDRFPPGVLIWAWTRIKAPREERLTLRWYAGSKSIHSMTFGVKPNLERGYLYYAYKLYSPQGRHEVRLYNSRNTLIGRRVFYVGRQNIKQK